jgi:hypothetical protein
VTYPVTLLAHHRIEEADSEFAVAMPMISKSQPVVIVEPTPNISPDTGRRHVPVEIADLACMLRSRWTKDTSANADHWSLQNPSYGQCAVTSLIVQDLFGGCLLRAHVNNTTHYWNRLPSGEEVDLTRDQFGGPIDVPPGEERSREYVLSFPDTVRRYRLLAYSIREALLSDE